MTTALIIGDIQRGITGAYPFARQHAVDAIAVVGVATSAIVAATCDDAGDRGYRITVGR